MIESNDKCLRDSEIALADAIKTIVEVLISKEITTAAALAGLFERQRKQYPIEMPLAIFVMKSLHDFAADPDRAKVHEFLRSPPRGSA